MTNLIKKTCYVIHNERLYIRGEKTKIIVKIFIHTLFFIIIANQFLRKSFIFSRIIESKKISYKLEITSETINKISYNQLTCLLIFYYSLSPILATR
jgi:hypothetical protein